MMGQAQGQRRRTSSDEVFGEAAGLLVEGPLAAGVMAVAVEERAIVARVQVEQFVTQRGQALGAVASEEEARSQPEFDAATTSADSDAAREGAQGSDARDRRAVGAKGDDDNARGFDASERRAADDNGFQQRFQGRRQVWSLVARGISHGRWRVRGRRRRLPG